MTLSERELKKHALGRIRRAIQSGEATKADLERWAAELDIAVEGTGSKGAVTKGDLRRAFMGEEESAPAESTEEES